MRFIAQPNQAPSLNLDRAKNPPAWSADHHCLLHNREPRDYSEPSIRQHKGDVRSGGQAAKFTTFSGSPFSPTIRSSSKVASSICLNLVASSCIHI